MNDTGVILLGRGGYGAPAAQMQTLVDQIQQEALYDFVQAAFVDQESPSLLELLESHRNDGLQRVLIVPVYFPVDRSLETWVSKVLRRWLHQHQPQPFDVFLTDNLGHSAELSQTLLSFLQRVEAEPGQSLSAAGVRANSPEWSFIPPARKHVLVCRAALQYGRCRASSRQALQCLNREKLGDDEVLVAQTGCLFPCNLGPTVVVYPEGVWYSGLDASAVEQIVEEHFLGGHIVEHYARYPSSEAQRRPSSGEQQWEDAL